MANQSNDNSIPLSDAAEWTKRWRDTGHMTWANQPTDDLIKGFLIPFEDIKELQKESGFVNIRAYLGLRERINEKGKTISEIKLVIVGTDREDNDLIGEGDKVYDFTTPCPPRCGNGNVLNGNKSSS